jgi:hypothetical protein
MAKADSSKVFVTEKEIRHAPLGIAVFDNRIVLSSTPSIIVYTDVNRNQVFEAEIDQREVFLTGFRDANHDHTLHAVVGAPSGQWHFSYGNRGADIKTKDGRHFISGCYYGYTDGIGKKSSDGEVYVGGMSMRINPDGTGLLRQVRICGTRMIYSLVPSGIITKVITMIPLMPGSVG